MFIGFIDTVHPILWERLTAAGHTCLPLYDLDRESLKPAIKDLDGLVIRSRTRMDEDLLEHARELKFIARSGAGMENIDLVYCRNRKIHCFNSPEGNRDAVGEQAIGMLLMLFNHLKRADTEVRNGIWKREENRGHEISGKTIGVIGYGQMGSAFAEKLRGFDCKILVHDKYQKGFAHDHITECELTQIQSEADVISLHLPQSEETFHYINETFISSCKKNFYLINTARGKNVDTAALVNAMKSGKILGACLDVLEYETASFESLDVHALPEPMQYLIQAENVVMSPHIAGWTFESHEKLSSVLADKILAEFSS